MAIHSQQRESAPSTLLSLPTELLLRALDVIPMEDLLHVRETNKFFGDLANSVVFKIVRISNRPERSRARLSEATGSHARTTILDWDHRATRDYTERYEPMPTAGVCYAGEIWINVREAIITREMTQQIATEADGLRRRSDSAVSGQKPVIAFLQKLKSLTSLMLYGADQGIFISGEIGNILRPPTLNPMRALRRVTLYLNNATTPALDYIRPNKSEEKAGTSTQNSSNFEVTYVYGDLNSWHDICASWGDPTRVRDDVSGQINSLGRSVATVLGSGEGHRLRVVNSSNIVRHAPTGALFDGGQKLESADAVRQVLESSVRLKGKGDVQGRRYIEPSQTERVKWIEDLSERYDAASTIDSRWGRTTTE